MKSEGASISASTRKKAFQRIIAGAFLGLACLVLMPAYLPVSAPGQDIKSPPPGVPTDDDPQAYVGMTDDQVEKLKSGGIVILNQPENFSGKRLIAAAYILNQDIDTVWELMTQPWRQDEYQPGLDKSTLVEKYEDGNLVDFYTKVMTVTFDYRIRHTNDKSQYYVHWELDPSYENNVNVKDVTGYFRFYWIDENHTLMRYGSMVEPKTFLPPAVQVFLARTALPSALKAVNKWVDSGGAYRKKSFEEEAEAKEE